ncbi:unnamed protein product [Rotaria sp. Silwood2]|nr:unnamed protein product [Rotaria sp. Silwood2]CAF2864410.1 unnamed protein product [Rotaria sp. Silwood2]CAF3124325.1 unnamed protein product [Rotaria sp. Silwood2]CAF3283498.1 unnamed protein product [Rotaria sp. Silwood2]CAF4255520.1 unnamed protein product [Rotaria sp. Silwood2]
MIDNSSISKDDLYGPPPAYSVRNNYENPPPPPPPSYTPSIYVVPIRDIHYQERLSSSHSSIILPKKFTRYLLGSGLMHMMIGLAAIVCDIILTIMNESYSFTGLWTGALSIILGIDLILLMSRSNMRVCSLQRIRLIHMAICLVSIVAIILTSINLASDSCYKIFLGPDRCRHSSHLIKIILVTLFSCNFIQLCITIVMTFIYMSKSHEIVTRNDSIMPEIIS